MQYASEWRMLALSCSVGKRGDVPVELRGLAERGHEPPRLEQHRHATVEEAGLVVLGLHLDVRRHDAVQRAQLEELLQRATSRPAMSRVKRVGFSSSSTSSPRFDQTNGAKRMIVGSTPSP